MAKQKVLIVEDEEDIRELIHFHLYKAKYEVIESDNGVDAIEKIRSEKPDVVLLDIMIPKLSGLEVCEAIRRDKNFDNCKIIFISAKGEEEDIVKGLELGADDYVAKPFSPKILVARVKAALRQKGKDSNSYKCCGIDLNEGKRVVLIDGKDIGLSVTEFEILKMLFTNPGNVYTRVQIVNGVKGHNHAVTDRSVDTQVVSIRKKMKDKGSLIETVWGVGYRFSDDEN
jgi:two-component system phosphate regulon response regulator PhoB